MTPVNAFVWRLRLYLMLAAGGLVLLDDGRNAGPSREPVAGARVAIECPPAAARQAAMPQGSRPPPEPMGAHKACGPAADPAAVRTTKRRQLHPETAAPPRIGALAAR